MSATCRSIWVLFQGGGAAGSQAYAAYTSADGVAGSRVVVAPMLVGSNSRFAGVTPLDSYSGPFAAVSASKAVFLGECPACDPQRVTVLRTHDGGTHWERSVVDGFAPTGVAFADAAHGWMTAVIGGTGGAAAGVAAHRRRPHVAPRVRIDIEPLHGRHPPICPAGRQIDDAPAMIGRRAADLRGVRR